MAAPPRATVTAPRRVPAAAVLLERSLGRFRGELTVADAATRGGLALRDAELGLRELASSRAGHIKATDAGELIYAFPDGLVRPADQRPGRKALRAVGRVLASIGRFVVRAWVSVVLVGYAVVFAAVMIALASRDDDGDGVSGVLAVVGRVLFEAVFWTFHPFSPVALSLEPAWARRGFRRAPRLPFYERVNRFVFGPAKPVEDPRARERDLLAEVRRLGGRVGPEDVMRVTGLDREAAERELLRLVVDYEGDIEVADAGALVYTFRALRTTAALPSRLAPEPAVAPIWNKREELRPVTGNSGGTNAFLGFLNGFNLAASGVAVSLGLTVERVGDLIARAGADAATQAVLGPLPPSGVPLLLGWVPLLFSAGLFALPLGRLLRRRREAARVAAENGRRSLLGLVLGRAGGERVEVTPAEAAAAWAVGARSKPREADVEAAVRALGGDIELGDGGAIVYRFADAARERRALAAARATAAAGEASPGQVVFDSGS